MAFEQKWEEVYSTRAWGKYPAIEVVRNINRQYGKIPNRKNIKVLELGCGGGAQIWFLAREGFDAYGIDGSTSAIKQAQSLLDQDNLQATLSIQDFTQINYPDNFFDAILDISSIQHNSWEDIQLIHKEIRRVLKFGGIFWGRMLNRETSGIDEEESIGLDSYRRIPNGPAKGEMIVHLISIKRLEELLRDYHNVSIDKITSTENNRTQMISHFWVAAQKL